MGPQDVRIPWLGEPQVGPAHVTLASGFRQKGEVTGVLLRIAD